MARRVSGVRAVRNELAL